MSELKDCPFCGEEAELVSNYPNPAPSFCVKCSSCEISTLKYISIISETYSQDGKALAIKRWNTRHTKN